MGAFTSGHKNFRVRISVVWVFFVPIDRPLDGAMFTHINVSTNVGVCIFLEMGDAYSLTMGTNIFASTLWGETRVSSHGHILSRSTHKHGQECIMYPDMDTHVSMTYLY